MGRSRTSHRGGGLTEKQDKFVHLIAQGVSNSEACRIVGMDPSADRDTLAVGAHGPEHGGGAGALSARGHRCGAG